MGIGQRKLGLMEMDCCDGNVVEVGMVCFMTTATLQLLLKIEDD